MKTPLLLLILTLAAFACTSPYSVRSLTDLHQPEAQSQLLNMQPDLLKEFLKTDVDRPTLVEFSADWCVPCKQLRKPIWRFAEEGQGRYRVIVVDVTKNSAVMQEFGLKQALPAFIVRLPGNDENLVRYGGGNDSPFYQIRHWLQSPKPLTASPLPKGSPAKPKAYRAMLIAGSAENANFLQELYWNYAWLRQNGYKPDEIGCFYGQPDILQYMDDSQQFDTLQEMLTICHPNQKPTILASLHQSMAAHPKDFYLYITSHGAAPANAKQQEIYTKICNPFAPSLILDQTPSDCESRRGIRPTDLAEAFKKSPETFKVLVLQGCYTGDFIGSKDKPSALALLPNTRILTASNAQHASFGCNAGEKSTYYGYAFNREIVEQTKPMAEINWADIHEKTRVTVNDLEKKLPARQRGSDPQYFANSSAPFP